MELNSWCISAEKRRGGKLHVEKQRAQVAVEAAAAEKRFGSLSGKDTEEPHRAAFRVASSGTPSIKR